MQDPCHHKVDCSLGQDIFCTLRSVTYFVLTNVLSRFIRFTELFNAMAYTRMDDRRSCINNNQQATRSTCGTMAQASSRQKGELACDPCRKLKVKCRRDSEDDTICQKCKRHNVECTWSAVRVRTRRPTSKSQARIRVLETKIDQLLSAVEEKSHASINSSESRLASHSPTSGGECLFDTLHRQFGLSATVAEKYVQQFALSSLYLPVVIIPASTTMVVLARTSPMLCLAVLTACSFQNRKLQIGLEGMLRKQLAEVIMIHQKRDLDILAAILMYLGWSQFYYVPKRESTSQFMWLAVTICEELGLGLTQEEAVKRPFCHRPNTARTAPPTSAQKPNAYILAPIFYSTHTAGRSQKPVRCLIGSMQRKGLANLQQTIYSPPMVWRPA